ncbi:hypothetical protein C5167_047017 [Papaver somniferum]|uniref:Uncharacterized protein n=1 Tax=Papaver somniferum TaxID=3469 RepID=A0A4Y7LIA1_PAPSO|nr:uncharacterized protein LOC113322135 [Papaver somniferum]RZC84228.1 hypothetical protein C5167_047017 [Papaver somniferum]
MGGGGAIWRSTAKVGIGAIGNHYRGLPSSPVPLADRVVNARNSAIPPSNPNPKLINLASLHNNNKNPSSSYSYEVNDWEFIINESNNGERIIVDLNKMCGAAAVDHSTYSCTTTGSGDFIFGSVPSLDEAKSATSDLKDALGKIYFTPGERTAGFHSQPNQAFQAFALLQDSPEVQNVVAALASDKNVWEAVMKNEELMEFYRKANMNEYVPDVVGVERKHDDGVSFGNATNGLISLIDMIKEQVLAMVSSLTEFFQHIFRTAVEGINNTDSANNSIWKCTSAKGAPFMALTIAAIMVVMVKRA